MRPASEQLIALLNSQRFVTCNLFTFTLITGVDYRWTDADVDIPVGDHVFSSTGPAISGAKYRLVRGMQVSDLQLSVLVKPTDLVGGVPWFLATRSGALKNCHVRIDKAFMQDWGKPAESLVIFEGDVTESYDTDQEVVLTVASDAKRLNTSIPRQIFQPGCMRTLYDSGCGVDKVAYSFEGTATTVPNRHSFTTSLGQPDNYFAFGEIIFTSGDNSGVRRSVKGYVANKIELSYPLTFDLQEGDTFTIRAGCDRTRGENGCAKFANVDNFQGTPYVPPPESAI
ncbi:DUF2163 domain-containing protein [Undibacterium sp. Di26W]|uniref:DUF2163 domain-containing protein n=1 Tax=Undibacterium sp. Di26W TaxID=3413035 RepID=UPI003BF458CC